MRSKNFYIPQLFTFSRVILTVLFLFLYLFYFLGLAIFIFSIAVATDIIDGKLARKYDVCSTFGFFFDVTADFFLVFTVFMAFIIDGIYPLWFLFLMGFMFLQFILTSKIKEKIYDPIGKYLFLFLIIVVFITFCSVEPAVCCINCVAFIGFSGASIISRYISLRKVSPY